MFSIIGGKGFHMTFKNGNTISVQFGFGHYCDRHYVENGEKDVECKNAEVAVWDADKEWITNTYINCGDDDVVGYLSTDEVAGLIYRVKNGG